MALALFVVFILFVTESQTKLVLDNLSSRIVTTKYGRLRGVMVKFPQELKLQPVEAYLGMEYASLHGSDLRFMPPSSPVEKWQGVKIANAFKPVCPQKLLNFDQLLDEMPLATVERLQKIAEYTKTQSEECLFLNIYIPARVVIMTVREGESWVGRLLWSDNISLYGEFLNTNK